MALPYRPCAVATDVNLRSTPAGIAFGTVLRSVPDPLLNLTAVRTTAGVFAVGNGSAHDGLTLVRDDGQTLLLHPTISQPAAIAVGANGGVLVAAVLATGRQWILWHISAALEMIGVAMFDVPLPNGTSQGILWLHGDQPGFAELERVRVVNGVTFVYPITVGPWTVGQLADGDFIGLAHADGRLWQYPVYTPCWPQVALDTDGQPRVAVTTTQGLFLTLADFTPYVPPLPTFTFQHPVLVAPFKDPAHTSGATMAAEDVGVFVEDSTPPTPVGQRVIWCHDGPEVPQLPPLRPWDQVWVECYRQAGESLVASERRWQTAVQQVLAQCANDVGIIPMFYCQGGAPPNELWTVAEVLAGLRTLSALVNSSSRIKVVAPFAWERANGITAHPELQQAWRQLLAAGGQPTFIPIPSPAPFFLPGHRMSDTKQGYLKFAGKFTGIDPTAQAGEGDAAFPVYADREAAGSWEQVEVTKVSPTAFTFRYLAANRFLSLTPERAFESRAEAHGWETLQGAVQPDGTILVYRREGDTLLPVLTFVEA